MNPAATCGVGPLPHVELDRGAEFAASTTTIPTLPTLPRRSPFDTPDLQAMAAMAGVSIDTNGQIAVEPSELGTGGPPDAIFRESQFVDTFFPGFVATLAELKRRRHRGSVKWQISGPLTVAARLADAGAPIIESLDAARHAVSQRVDAIGSWVAASLGDIGPQLIMLQEAELNRFTKSDGPTPLASVADGLSMVMASGAKWGEVGIAGPPGGDISAMIEAGPTILAVDHGDAERWPGHLASFVTGGGSLIWAVAPATGPLPKTCDRAIERLRGSWHEVIAHGTDPRTLALASGFTTDAGLVGHDESTAGQVMTVLNRMAERVAADALIDQ